MLSIKDKQEIGAILSPFPPGNGF
ncbi:hypothetical protein RCEC007_450003 [Escherichia coli]|nr:hypothetical protein HMVEC_1100003 [Escherichia coli]SJK88952.1 hypothetical protein RCEC007_450003 [Escherichia coli]